MSILARIEAGGGYEIRISLEEYRGKRFVDIRKFYYEVPDGAGSVGTTTRLPGDFKPTSKGITVRTAEAASEIAEALTKSRGAIEKFLSE
jgi:hypothetical protein